MESTSMIDGDGAPAVVAVAVKGGPDGGTGSRRAVRWAVDNLFHKADRFVLIHVIPNITSIPTPSGDHIPIEELDSNLVAMYVEDIKSKSEELFIPFKRLCKGRKIETLVVEGDDPASTLVRYVSDSRINTLVLGSCSSSWLTRKLYGAGAGVPLAVLEHAPKTCSIYVVSTNGVISSSGSSKQQISSRRRCHCCGISRLSCGLFSSSMESKVQYMSLQSSTSYLSSRAPNHVRTLIPSSAADSSSSRNLSDTILQNWGLNETSVSSTSRHQSNSNAEAQQLRLELQNAVNMYNQACEDLVHTQTKVQMLSSDCLEDAKKINTSVEQEQKFRKIAAEEKERHLEAVKEVEMARNLLEKEAYERELAELKALKESLEKYEVVDAVLTSDKRYRRYAIDEIERATDSFDETKVVGEGAYGRVYKCYLDGTPVAIKVLWSDTSEKKQEFLREVEVLSQLRHPHMVQLLGACPEKGCLIYEYMENGSLEDYISHKTTKPPLSWNARFRIAFEVACALAFLHNAKPEPIIHRDLKPGNILLDQNYVSKIGDVGMAKFITDTVPDDVTEYRDSVLVGTMFYIDPEYHRTGTIRPKSDLYAFGIIILQLLTLLRPKGITSKVESAVDCGSLSDILDGSVNDWPLAEAEELAQIGLKCCSLRCRDRPDLDSEVLPVLKRLVEFGNTVSKVEKSTIDAPSHFYCPILQEVMDDPHIAADGFTYEYIAIQRWFEKQNTSPVAKRQLQHKTLTPNHTLRSAIQEWRSQLTPSKS